MNLAESLVQIVTTKVLQEWASIRDQLEVLEAKRREIEPLAFEESLAILQSKTQGDQKQNKSQVVWENKATGKRIIIQFRKDRSVLNGNPVIQELDEQIALEQEKAKEANAQEIELVESQLEQAKKLTTFLEARLQELSQTPESESLLKYREEFIEEISSVKKPVLAYEEIPAPKSLNK